MTKVRLIIFVITIIVVGGIGYLVSLYARGYRFNPETFEFNPNGLLVLKSEPDGAQIFINGELETATNTTLPLPPGTYDVSIRKEGYRDWNKRLTIDEEVVTEATAHLFVSAPSLSAVTFSGILNPAPNHDLTKISYAVPSIIENPEKAGLWVMETVNLPLGFSREPRRITDGDLESATWQWSPDSREILLTTPEGVYLLDANTFTSQTDMVNIQEQKQAILTQWEEEEMTRLSSQLKKLPDELESILERKATSIVFSPDEDMVLYTASSSATIPNELKDELPGASTQKEQRDIKEGQTFVYDIKEDKNFLVYEDPHLYIKNGFTENAERRMSWFPTSRHVVLAEKEKVTIMDYDSTNKQEVYSGSYLAPHAYPAISTERLLILTNLGANSTLPNLYSLSLK